MENDTVQGPNLTDLIVELTTGAKVVMDGSLSQICSDQLSELYARKNTSTLYTGMESYEQDLVATVGVWDGLRRGGHIPLDPEKRTIYLYSARQGDVSMSDVAKFSDALDDISVQGEQALLFIQPDEQADSTLSDEMKAVAQLREVPILSQLSEVAPAIEAMAGVIP